MMQTAREIIQTLKEIYSQLSPEEQKKLPKKARKILTESNLENKQDIFKAFKYFLYDNAPIFNDAMTARKGMKIESRFELFYKHSLVEACEWLHDANLFKQKYFELVAAEENPTQLAMKLSYLKHRGMLKGALEEKCYMAISQSSQAIEVADALPYLSERPAFCSGKSILKSPSLDLYIQAMMQCPKKGFSITIAACIVAVYEYLKPYERFIFLSTASPLDLANILRNILSDDKLDFLEKESMINCLDKVNDQSESADVLNAMTLLLSEMGEVDFKNIFQLLVAHQDDVSTVLNIMVSLSERKILTLDNMQQALSFKSIFTQLADVLRQDMTMNQEQFDCIIGLCRQEHLDSDERINQITTYIKENIAINKDTGNASLLSALGIFENTASKSEPALVESALTNALS